MADRYKVLGQAAPSATTETTLYTVPAGYSSIINTLYVCNRAASSATFRISISVGGGATANKDYLYYGLALTANNTFTATVGLTVAATDIVRVYASSSDLSFSLFGLERVT